MTIYIHRGCFDGAASGALAVWLHAQRHQARNVDISPIGYVDAAAWLLRPLVAGACVVDFLYHPSAELWWDHHVNPFRREVWRKDYERKESSFVQWDPKAPSCAGLIVRCLLAEGIEPPEHLRRTAEWADLIDSASYPTPEDAVTRPSAARQLALSLMMDDSVGYETNLVRALSERDIKEVRTEAPFRQAASEAMARYARGLERMRQSASLEGNVVVYRVDSRGAICDRLMAFYLHRDADYSLGIIRTSAETKVSANANPWRRPDGPNLGRIFERHGGGGHHDVGSVIFPGAHNSRPERVLREVLKSLRVHPTNN
jgi:hypothetical protein